MYNNQGYPGGAQSPPLHHPVPQHPIQLPADAVPPPQTAQQYSGMSAGYQNPAPQGGHARTASYEAGGNPYLGLFNDSTTQMGFQVGKNAVMAGSEFVEQRLHKYVSVSDLKLYFQVSNSYVMKKLFLILFPYRHKSWARIPRRGDPSGAPDGWATPSEDINAPDLYIPLMATVTLVVLWSYLAGFHGDFRADGIVNNASKTAAYGILDMLILKLGSYLLNADSNFLDLVAYSGYKFVP